MNRATIEQANREKDEENTEDNVVSLSQGTNVESNKTDGSTEESLTFGQKVKCFFGGGSDEEMEKYLGRTKYKKRLENQITANRGTIWFFWIVEVLFVVWAIVGKITDENHIIDCNFPMACCCTLIWTLIAIFFFFFLVSGIKKSELKIKELESTVGYVRELPTHEYHNQIASFDCLQPVALYP